MKLRKTIAAALSAAMILSSFSAFAVENDIPVLDNLDTYLSLDTDLKAELPDVEVMSDTTDVVETTDEPTLAPVEAQEQETEDEPVYTFDPAVPNIPLWDFADPLDWDEELGTSLDTLGSTDTFQSESADWTSKISWAYNSNTETLYISGTGKVGKVGSTLPTWRKYAYNNCVKRVVVESGITEISDSCGFSDFIGLETVRLPDTLINIGDSCFLRCSKLTKIELPNSLKYIGDWAFRQSGLKEIVIPELVTNISKCAFYGCTSLEEIVIPNNITRISEQAFFGCTALKSVQIGSNVHYIDTAAFMGCTSLETIIIPSCVTVMGQYTTNASYSYHVFDGCVNLKTIYVNKPRPKNLTSDNIYLSIMSNNTTAINPTIIWGEMTISSIPDQYYVGNPIEPKISISYNDRENPVVSLVEGTDYTLSYINNNAAGTGTVNITYLGDYVGYNNAEEYNHVDFNILDADVSTAIVSSIASQTYTGTAIMPTPTVTFGGKTLVKDTNYTLSYSNNINVGTATVTISGKDVYKGAISKTFSIVRANVSSVTVEVIDTDISYQGEPVKPAVKVSFNGKVLVEGQDYTVSYSNNNGEGTGRITVSGKGNFTGTKTVNFIIGPFKPSNRDPVPMDNDALVEGSVEGTFVYDGTAKEPKPVLVYHFVNPTTHIALDYPMVEGTDYEIVSYNNNINAGKAIVTLRGMGSFKDETSIFFNISPCELSATTIADIPSYEYCLKDICPKPEIKIGDKVMVKDVDYTLEYENNRNRGTASVIITGKGNLSGTLTKTFEITPRDGSRFVMIIVLI